ncbi:hypothetical protein J1G42_11855 [Cellulomonas sp. zg-ZUI222]|uniref:Uncharacterized protein n=1 Tax=Cellulomonas wangleii TaxID=2816956 RepID=A0ABX8D7Z9_9CELL|nr:MULTISPECIES: hypothetical protein [Cellulomonas]MBO0900864.1 hypothetical protein [Cellulomonas sp. zg-ZUI22]MBO0921519.1 hypothetical protein [Cellulomonas wangleii]MBO0925015.1 hypothetical protein [Cellulomonas wangleii]QVI63564.1 hypothetical protein KG103_06820 [Cellulomonas wangleii]
MHPSTTYDIHRQEHLERLRGLALERANDEARTTRSDARGRPPDPARSPAAARRPAPARRYTRRTPHVAP